MHYLITGASGFLGPYIIDRILSQGDTCRCLVRPESVEKIRKEARIEVVCGDVTRRETIEGIGKGMDRLIHMATLGHMDNFTVSEEMFNEVNVRGTVNIMQEALKSGIPRVLHCSSVAAMGICDDVPADETSPCNPHHAYGRSKLAAEKEVFSMVTDMGLPAVIVRFSMVYGPGDRRDMLKLARLAKKGLFPKVGRKPKLTPLIHARDAVQGMLLALEKGRTGELYLITNAESEPFDRIRKIIQEAMGIRRPAIYVPEWAALAIAEIMEKSFQLFGKTPPVSRKNIESTLADRVFSIDKAVRELGFKPGVDVEEGLRETISWYMEKGWL